ncbi:hypothetical protein J0H58_12185 [bacterium]|nr:hypothetical protein [bacterium]
MTALYGNKQFTGDVTFSLCWLPTPRVRFYVPAVPDGHRPGLGGISFVLSDGTRFDRNLITRVGPAAEPYSDRSTVSGVVNPPVIRPVDHKVSYVLFLFPNFEAPLGSGLQYADGWQRAARLTLIAGGWTVTLDQLPDYKERVETLNAASGFAVTHAGRLERDDGQPFRASDARPILDALGWYVSFCTGQWAGPCLPAGFEPSGARVWQGWDYQRTAPFRQRQSWLDRCHHEGFEGPFAGFLRLWQDDAWEQVVRLAIHWYVEANAQAGSIEGAIVLTQTAFELLASAVLVENHAWLSTDGYEKLAAADRVRLLFRWAGIPTGIPAELEVLSAAAGAENWPDAPTAMTAVRNTITHPTLKNREKFGRHPGGARAEVWSLGLWALELCLLRLFGYRGMYGNRITQRHTGEVEEVPWASGPI